MLGHHIRDLALPVIPGNGQRRYPILVASVDQSRVGLDQFPSACRVAGPNGLKDFLQGRTSWVGRNTVSDLNTSQPR
jgi:hypothetical protein